MKHLIPIFLAALAVGCSGSSRNATGASAAADDSIEAAAVFDADSAFSYVRAQVAFGPRVPGTEGNRRCGDYIISELRRHGVDSIAVQTTSATAFNGDALPVRNIFASINPGATDRLLFAAHYDTRPWADNETDPELRNKPIDGANDGGSGVAVMLEMARQIARTDSLPVGVDLLFVDAEDYGDGESSDEESWCLGTRRWVKQMPYSQENRPRYAVVLDMVGGAGARFHREYFSDRFAPAVVSRIWEVARRSGYAGIFQNSQGGAVVDDHTVLNSAGIPAVDVIESRNAETGTFPPTWHTHADNIENIDPASLKAAGQTMINLIFNEKPRKK